MKKSLWFSLLLIATALAEEKKTVQGHVFAWPFTVTEEMQPRGGITTGSEVTLDEKPSARWEALQEEKLRNFEKDRRAILAMEGNYRVSFDFTELFGLTKDFKPRRPYFTWATENIAVLDRFFSPLQGGWTHAVFQVDDSPRYESTGAWSHTGAESTWSGHAWRPLPRREFSVRDDYQILEGRDEITITPTGWVHFQNNGKIKLTPEVEMIGREIGVNRYERITTPDLSAAGESWEKVAPYWAEVREMWQEVMEKNETFTLRSKVEGKKLFEHHFGYAAKVAKEGYDPVAGRKHVRDTIIKFLSSGDGKKAEGEKY